MKKVIAFLLAVLMLSMLLVGCTDTDDKNDSGEGSAVVSDAVSDDADVSNEESDEESVEASKEQSIAPEPIDPEFKTLISTGCSYTKSCEAGEAYPDSYDAELTDGLFAPVTEVGYGDVKLSGYAPAGGIVDVVIDLGKEYDKLCSFAGSFLLTRSAGISPPSVVTVRVSVDGKEWTRAGSLKSSVYEENTMGIYSLDTKEYFTGRYVKFSISKGSAWVFLDELMVYADIPSDENSSSLIGEEIIKLYSEDNGDYASAVAKFTTNGNTPDYSLTKTLISSSKAYTLSADVLDRYPDSKKLTDGVLGTYYESGTWIGFDGGEDVEIVINLGTTARDICGLSLHSFVSQSTKIYLPLCVTFSLATTKDEYTEIGRVYAPVEYASGVYAFSLEFDKCLTAKYVKISIKGAGENTTMLVDEACVYAYRNVADGTEALYPDPEFPDKGTINYFNSSEKDYNVEKNLLLGLGQSIVPGTVLDKSAASNNTSYTTTWLTDGEIPSSMSIHDGHYFKSNSGIKRSVVYDLGASCALTEFSAAFLDRREWAVTVPGQVGIELSQDAENWYVAGYINFVSTDKVQVIDNKLVLDKPVQARYVRFAYQIGTWAGCAELRAVGKKNASGAVKLADAGFAPVRTVIDGDYQAPQPDLLKGSSEISLMYHSQSYNYKEETFMPYLAYIDEDGNMKDTMFDGFLFLLSGTFPSGVAQYQNSVMSDWKWELATLYKDGQNIMALESAAAKAKKALGLPDDYKYKYFVSIYYPRVEVKNFGDVDGDGVSEDLSVFENRQKVIQWYIDLALEYDKNAGFKNIELGGFYWFHEAMESSDDSNKLLNMISNETQAKGYQLFWIPYYCSNGVAEWADYGFATACMQPNYVFRLNVPLSNIKNAATIIKRLGMCIEIEISGDCLVKPEFYTRYLEYLKGGVYYGYMNDCIHMYYQDMQVYYNACNSQYPMSRSIYDYTYQFMKGTLNVYPDVKADINIETSVDTTVGGKLGENISSLADYLIVLSPEHGTVTISPDGSYVYYPDKGYTGSDSFEYKYSEGLDYSAPCKVTVTVK